MFDYSAKSPLTVCGISVARAKARHTPLRALTLSLTSGGKLRRAAFDAMREGGILADPAGRILAVNQAALDITGYDPGELTMPGRIDDPLVQATQAAGGLDVHATPLALASRGEIFDGGPVYVRHQSGFIMPVTACAIPLPGAHGDPAGILEIFARIRTNSGRRQIEYQEESEISFGEQLRRQRYREANHLRHEIQSVIRTRQACGLLRVNLADPVQLAVMMGHGGRGEAIAVVGETLQACLRSADHVVHWGCDRFIVLLRLQKLDDLSAVKKRIEDLLGLIRFTWWGSLHAVQCMVEGRPVCELPRLEDIENWAAD